MAKSKDVFGFDELQKEFQKVRKKYPEATDAMLMTHGRAIAKKVKKETPVYEGPPKKNVKPGQLKRSWTVKRPKDYRGGKVKVVRVQSTASHAHFIEDGHRIVRGGKTRVKGRQLNAVQRNARGIKILGKVEGMKILDNAMKEARNRFEHDAEKTLKTLLEGLEL